MRPITVQKTITEIVARSGEVVVPYGSMLSLVADDSGRYLLAEKLFETQPALKGRVRPLGPDGRRLRPGHVLTTQEAERAVRVLLGLDE